LTVRVIQMELKNASYKEGKVSMHLHASVDQLIQGIGDAVYRKNYEAEIYERLTAAMSNGGRMRYDVSAGPSGVKLECNRLGNDDYEVNLLYQQNNVLSRQNTLGLVDSLRQETSFSSLPEAIRQAEAELGSRVYRAL
jgi:hypothetical protein